MFSWAEYHDFAVHYKRYYSTIMVSCSMNDNILQLHTLAPGSVKIYIQISLTLRAEREFKTDLQGGPLAQK